MKRLTKRIDGEVTQNTDHNTPSKEWRETPKEKRFRNSTGACMEKLAAYEDADEQGRLIILPCIKDNTKMIPQVILDDLRHEYNKHDVFEHGTIVELVDMIYELQAENAELKTKNLQEDKTHEN
jgi:hypothetical protein